MKFRELSKLVPEAQDVHLIYSSFELFGGMDALSCMVNKEIDECEVVNIEAENDALKVWVENK